MKNNFFFCMSLLILFQNLIVVKCFEPISLGTVAMWGAGVAVVGYFFSDKKVENVVEKVVKRICQGAGYCESCGDRWITDNLRGLEMDLKSNVFGQNLAVETVLTNMKYHLQQKSRPTRALVMSFHGAPGVGKNMVSQLILKNLFKLGGKTEFVHFFRGSIDFPVREDKYVYNSKIKNVIESKVQECNRAMFVFDEVDKIPPGTLDVLRPYLDHRAIFDGIDYRRTIFIFLSNLGSGAITQKSLELWQDGVTREEFNLSNFDETLKNSVYKQEGGFYKSDLIRNFVIDVFVPFLPLEKKHVYQCLETEVAKMGQVMSEELFTQVLEMLTFGPEPYSIFAINGCKLIGEKAGPLIERELYRKRRQMKENE